MVWKKNNLRPDVFLIDMATLTDEQKEHLQNIVKWYFERCDGWKTMGKSI